MSGREREERLRPERPFDVAQGRPELAEGRGAKSPSEREWGCPPPLVAENADDQLLRGHAVARTAHVRAEAEGSTSKEKRRMNPRSDVVGSLLRPRELLDARVALERGEITA